MLAAILIFVIAYAFIASEKIDKAIAALLGAGAMIIFGVADFNFMLSKVDLNVFGLLIGMMIIVNIMGTTGIFEWIAVTIAKKTRGNGVLVMIMFMISTAVISAFMDNVTTVILMVPVTILICQLLQLPVVPILILEAIFSNIGGTATLIGDPPNILIGAATGLTFHDFMINLMPITAFIGTLCLGLVLLIFRHRLQSSPAAIRQVMLTEPAKAILNPSRCKRALAVFALTLAGFFIGHHFHLEPGLIALCGALVMLLVCKIEFHTMLEKVEWTTIMFFAGLFMMVGGLEENRVFDELGRIILGATDNNFALTLMVILWSAAIFSAIVDNIPLVIAMIPLIVGILPAFVKMHFPEIDVAADDLRLMLTHEALTKYAALGEAAFVGKLKLSNPEVLTLLTPEKLYYISEHISRPLLWALALGACLGGNGTLIGASANVVISQIANKNNYQLTFWKFSQYGFPLMLLSTALAAVYLWIWYC